MFSFVGWSENRITLGDLKGNKFEIVVRGLENERDLQVENVKNFFGEQRFGTIFAVTDIQPWPPWDKYGSAVPSSPDK